MENRMKLCDAGETSKERSLDHSERLKSIQYTINYCGNI